MTSPLRSAWFTLVAASMLGCGDPASVSVDAAAQRDAAPADAAGAVDAASAVDGATPHWQYIPTPGAFCANGSETGFGLNLLPGSDTLVIFLQGGGACWEAAACYALKSATHFEDTVQAATVLGEVGNPSTAALFDRGNPANPLPAATLVYVPYCTGDLHAGTHVQSYDFFGVKQAHHVGALNMDAYLARLKPMVPGVRRVVLTGISAGGFGASLNWWRVRAAFGPGVRVDLLDDCGPLMEVAPDGRWGTLKAAWGLSVPPDCVDCGLGLSRWMPYYATHVAAPDRYGLLAFRGDDVIGLFFGLSDPDQAQRLDALRAAAGPRQKVFMTEGNQHVMFGQNPWPTAGGVPLGTWVRQFLSDDAAWDHKGP